MNTTIPSPAGISPAALPPLEKFLFAISAPVRWSILRELSAGEPLIVTQLAERLKCKRGLISKHMAVLREVGFVSANRVKQYSIVPQFAVVPAERQVDFGHALLRMGAAQ